jgi:hypothetical protein
MTHRVIQDRRDQQDALVRRARDWAGQVRNRLPDLVSVTVFGSVARGDFNLWSDIDVLVVADGLPDEYLERAELVSPVPPGIQAVIWTPAELESETARKNPIAMEVAATGIPLDT